MKYSWKRRGGYEVSSKGDSRFSALNAELHDGRNIESWYQCDCKQYQPGGTNWELGKGKSPLKPVLDLWTEYLNLWRLWAMLNRPMIEELRKLAKTKDNILSDCHASTDINQARALAQILTETELPESVKVLNKHYSSIPDDAVFIGRPSPFQNIYSHLPNNAARFKVATRDEAVSYFEATLLVKFRKDPASLARLMVALRGKSVVCFCNPAKCHGDVLVWFANLPENYARLIYRLEMRQ